MNLQGHAQTLLKEGQHYTKLPIWWCGMGLVVLGSVGDFVALGFATQALVAALGGATTLSTNLLIARFWKNQDINPLDGIGVVFIVAGAVIIAVKTPSSNNYSLQDMNQCVRASEFLIYLGVLGFSLLLLLSSVANSSLYAAKRRLIEALLRPLTRRVDRMHEAEAFLFRRLMTIEQNYALRFEAIEDACRDKGIDIKEAVEVEMPAFEPTVPRRELSTSRLFGSDPKPPNAHAAASHLRGTQLGNRLSADVSELREYFQGLQNPTRKAEFERYSKWYDTFIYAASSGALGSISVLLAGLVAKTFTYTIQDNDNSAWTQPAPYFFLLGMVLSVVWQTTYLNRALGMAKGSTTTVFPVFQGFWIGFGVLGGMLFYEQAHLVFKNSDGTFNAGNIVLYLFAFLSILLGCASLAYHGQQEYFELIKDKIADTDTHEHRPLNQIPTSGVGSVQNDGEGVSLRALSPVRSSSSSFDDNSNSTSLRQPLLGS